MDFQSIVVEFIDGERHMKLLHEITYKMIKSAGTAFFALLLLGATGTAFVATAPVANAATTSAASVPTTIQPQKTHVIIICFDRHCVIIIF